MYTTVFTDAEAAISRINRQIGKGLKVNKIFAMECENEDAYYKIITIGKKTCYVVWIEQPVLNPRDLEDTILKREGTISTKSLRLLIADQDDIDFP